jgi:hypothetical protein
MRLSAPPLKTGKLKRWIKRCLIALSGLAAAYTMLCGIENWRARRALAEHYAQLRAKGEPLEIKALESAEIPDDQNAACIPALECFYLKDPGTGKKRWAVKDLEEILEGLPTAQREALLAWQRLSRAVKVIWPLRPHSTPKWSWEKKTKKSSKVFQSMVSEHLPNLPAPFPEDAKPDWTTYEEYLHPFGPQILSLMPIIERPQWPCYIGPWGCMACWLCGESKRL